MEAEGSPETLVPTYRTTRRHIPVYRHIILLYSGL